MAAWNAQAGTEQGNTSDGKAPGSTRWPMPWASKARGQRRGQTRWRAGQQTRPAALAEVAATGQKPVRSGRFYQTLRRSRRSLLPPRPLRFYPTCCRHRPETRPEAADFTQTLREAAAQAAADTRCCRHQKTRPEAADFTQTLREAAAQAAADTPAQLPQMAVRFRWQCPALSVARHSMWSASPPRLASHNGPMMWASRW